MHFSKFFLYIPFFVIFIFIYIFNTEIFPIIPYNGDDWRYLSQFRSLLPSLKEWNPARVFPEILHPFLGYFAAYVVYPICNNYIKAISISSALLVSSCITILCAVIYFFIKKITQNTLTSVYSMAFFMLLSFVVFKSSNSQNVFLFYGYALTVITYYVVPNILNSVIVLFIAYIQYAEKEIPCKKYHFSCGVLLVCIYLSQFSMTFSSSISAIYAYMTIFMRVFNKNDKNIYEKLLLYVKTFSQFDALLFFIVSCWICAAIFDVQGERYASFMPTEWHFTDASQALISLLNKMRMVVKIITLAAVIGVISRIVYKKYAGKIEHRDKKIFETIVILSLSIIFLTILFILISSRTSIFTGNISATYGIFFFQLFLTVICIAYLAMELPLLNIFIPILLLFLLIETTNSTKPWAMPHGTAQERAIVDSWLTDVRNADSSGNNTATITVPQLAWPHPPEWFGEVLAHTLYTHGITSRRLAITLKKARN